MDIRPGNTISSITGDQNPVEYRFGRILGEGSYGTVWLAETSGAGELPAQKQVAIKILKAQSSCKNIELELHKYIEEIRAHRTMDARNIVSFLGEFNAENAHGLTFTRFKGTLRDLFNFYAKKQVGFSVPFVRFCAGEILQGLNFLHSIGIMFLDLKMGNILTSMTPAEIDNDEHGLVLCITDFGSATRTGTVPDWHCGSFEYDAPEIQIRRKFSTKSDIWSLMCIVYELFAGGILFDLFNSCGTRYDADLESLSGESGCGDTAPDCVSRDDQPSDVESSDWSSDDDEPITTDDKYRYWLLATRILGLPPDSLKTDEIFNSLGRLKYDAEIQRVSINDIIMLNVEIDPCDAANVAAFMERGIQWLCDDRASAEELLKDKWLNTIE